MKKFFPLFLLFNLMFFLTGLGQFYRFSPQVTKAGKGIVNTRVDNLGYWNRMIKKGYAKPNPAITVPKATFSGSVVSGDGLRTQDSPDVPVSGENDVTQSENSVFVSPEDEGLLLNSNNSTDWNGATANILSGANGLYSEDSGLTWGGELENAGLANSGDPATAIGLNGWWYVGKINNGFGQSVAYSSDQGQTWHDIEILTPTGSMDLLDKNHLCIDNSLSSPFEGHLYSAWTSLVNGGPNENQIEITRSADHGLTWSTPVGISQAVNAGSHNQGVNIQTGPDGKTYVAWSVYDSWPSDEAAVGFSKSIDGGMIFTPATRIINNIRGLRMTGTSKNMRVAAFPSMAVDNSNSPYRGTLYVVWPNIGFPGINTGSDIDIYMIKSYDEGETWSAPIKVNQDPAGLGKQHFMPWITCDQVTGNLCVVYYDDRNTSSSKCETWISYSYDGGESWSDLKVSDVAFTPLPITGLAGGYFGDYLGITARNRSVYPVWTDNRSGVAMSYVSPVSLGPAPNQPYVVFNSYELSNITGKNNLNMNYGDSLYMDLTLVNLGDQPAGLVSGYLSTPSPYVEITDTTGYYGYFDPGESKNLPMGYSMKVSDTIPFGYRVKFFVRASSIDTDWVSHFTIQAHAPGLKIIGISIVDTTEGNGNARLDAGETVTVAVLVSNYGDFPCKNTFIKISSGSDFLTFANDSVFLDSIVPGGNKIALFPTIVDNDACTGSSVDLNFNAFSGRYHLRSTFHEPIGGIMEDWESHTFTTFPWTSGGDKQWSIDTVRYNGLLGAKSGWIYDDQSTGLMVTYQSGADDSISFYRKVSSEANYDFLSFYIDNVPQDQWSGELDWQRVSFPVPAGTHVFRWEYATDVYQLTGANAAWIDDILFPSPPLPQVYAGPADTICAGEMCQLHGSVSAADSIRWTTLGDGIFSNNTIPDPVYTPGTNDIISGGARLRLRGTGINGCYSSSMQLAIGGIPYANITVEPSDTICAGEAFTLSADTAGGNTYLWTPGNLTGNEVSVDTSLTGGFGSKWFTLRVTNRFNCSDEDSVRLTFKNCTGIEEQGNSFTVDIFPNPNNGEFTLQIYAPRPEKIGLKLLNSLNVPVLQENAIPVSGRYKRHLKPGNLAPGIYFIVIERESGQISRKVVVSG